MDLASGSEHWQDVKTWWWGAGMGTQEAQGAPLGPRRTPQDQGISPGVFYEAKHEGTQLSTFSASLLGFFPAALSLCPSLSALSWGLSPVLKASNRMMISQTPAHATCLLDISSTCPSPMPQTHHIQRLGPSQSTLFPCCYLWESHWSVLRSSLSSRPSEFELPLHDSYSSSVSSLPSSHPSPTSLSLENWSWMGTCSSLAFCPSGPFYWDGRFPSSHCVSRLRLQGMNMSQRGHILYDEF